MNSIRQQLATEATETESRQHEEPGSMQRTRARGGAGHVYTVRMPADRLAELREMAAEHGEQPSALMRRWVLERLDAERDHRPDLGDIRRSLHEALDNLERITQAAS